jgi:hypothetical protein
VFLIHPSLCTCSLLSVAPRREPSLSRTTILERERTTILSRAVHVNRLMSVLPGCTKGMQVLSDTWAACTLCQQAHEERESNWKGELP